MYSKLHMACCDSGLYQPKPWDYRTNTCVLLLTSCLASNLAWAQTMPSEPARLPSLEVQRIHSTVVGLSPEAACNNTDAPQDAIELRDLRFSQVQTSALNQQAIATDSAVHVKLLQAARQHLQVPKSAPLSQPQSLCQLQELGVALSATYRSLSGLAAPIFVIDPQEVVDGVLHMQVLEAELESFELADADGLDRQAVLKAIQSQLESQQGQALRQDNLERSVFVLQYITGRNYQAFLSPGEQPLGVKVSLQPQPRQRFQGLLRVDNHGAQATGETQGSLVLQWRPGMVQGDQLTASYVSSQTYSALNAYSLSYEMPLGYQGWRGGVRSGQTNYALGGSLAATQATGNMANNSVYLQYPLLRSLVHSAELTLGAGEVVLRDNNASAQDPRMHHLLWSELRGTSQRDSSLQTWGLGLTAGRMRYDTAEQATTDASNLNRQGDYQLVNLDVKHSHALSSAVDLTGSYKTQWASKNLDSYHKMNVGGSNAVRAFASTEVTGDQAHLVRLELGYSQRIQNDSHRFSLFYDWAQTDINQSPLPTNAASNKVRIAGFGLQWELQQDTGLGTRLYWAKPQGGDRTTSIVDNKSERVGAELKFRF
jgi:hemolysin activation/secretion protein